MSSLQADSLPILNLLWRYYETNRLYMSAAKILHQLAHWDRYGCQGAHSLTHRLAELKCVECHLHALMCSVTVVFIHTMEDDQRLNTITAL